MQMTSEYLSILELSIPNNLNIHGRNMTVKSTVCNRALKH